MKICEAFIIGGSAGSIQVLLKILPDVDPLITFPIVIVLHRKSGKESNLSDLLQKRTSLTVKEVEEKEELTAGTIYLAPPDYHLLIENLKTFSLDVSEKVNFSRPSIDVTFESASSVYSEHLYCLLLSGANRDGTYGLQQVKRYGGTVLVQHPDSAAVPYMPENARIFVKTDAVLYPEEMAAFINKLSK